MIYQNSKAFPNNTQLSIALIKNGETQFYGIKRVNDSIVSIINKKSVFEIGSISKVFTSTLLANFVTENQIELEDGVNQYLEVPFQNNEVVSFASLANHTSGLPRLPSNLNLYAVDPNNPYAEYGEEKLKDYLSQELKRETIGRYAYSNLGAGLLGYTLSKISGSSYAELLSNKVLNQYNMTNSSTSPSDLKSLLVKGQNPLGEIAPNWDLNVLVGAGGILSNVEDLAKFAMAHFDKDNKELALTRLKTQSVNVNMDLGLGWHIIKNRSKNPWFWHNGGTGGYTSSMAIDVEAKNGIIILSNVSAFSSNMSNIDTLCFALMKTLE
ncbi:serine hydrolase domain-containing protein [Roseivirga sp. 4D4]|uniref:serine hydrolase domain-containing protein n=1 Tax=Roseivirga sp. 4D4 TaxID=1889784 RepID=UPI000AF2D3B1|nr:serine hydrolase domain-containing protein [Roseivirga sp. 4D4]